MPFIDEQILPMRTLYVKQLFKKRPSQVRNVHYYEMVPNIVKYTIEGFKIRILLQLLILLHIYFNYMLRSGVDGLRSLC